MPVVRTSYFLFFCLGLSLFSCNEDDSTVSNARVFENVDFRLQGFFRSFEDEAAARGLFIDLNETFISAGISELPGEGVAGQCRRTVNNLDNDIVIDESFFNNPNIPFLIKELVVYHELGHCFLERGHREGQLGNGACLSIMRSGLEDCRDNYNVNTRAFYIDELFDPDAF